MSSCKGKVDGKVRELQDAKEKDFNWSMKPLISWMKWIGFIQFPIPAAINNKKKGNSSLLSSFYRLFVWILAVGAQLTLFYTAVLSDRYLAFVPRPSYEPGTMRVTKSWNLLIFHLNKGIYSIVVHSIILTVFQKAWNSLKRSTETSEIRFGLRKLNYGKFRKLSALGVLYVLVADGTLIGLIIGELESTTMQPTFARKVMEVSCYDAKIYPSTVVVLFCLMCLLISDQLKLIEAQIEGLVMKHQEDPAALSTLQRQHSMVCRSIEKLNDGFGLVLLLEVPFNFIGVTNTITNFLLDGNAALSYNNWYYVALQLVNSSILVFNLLLICFCAEHVTVQSKSLSSILYLMADLKPNRKIEVQSFTTQVAQLSHEITACGFFKIDKMLILTLITTTITYVLLILQFQASEN